MDISVLDEVLPLLPCGMRAIANIGKVFTGTWQLMGFTSFAEALHDRPGLVERVFDRVAAIQSRITERVIEHPAVGAVLHADDLAYCSGPMVHPEVIRRHVFPAYRCLAEQCRDRRILYLFHSDGQIERFLPDIADCGFVGFHPVEPKAMDAVRVKREWGSRLCLLGNIDVDLLARGTPQEVRDHTKRCLDTLARDGGYCPGSGNSVPDYVPFSNFIAMIETVKEWR
jgi:uroporphyrinogen decarboxylase